MGIQINGQTDTITAIDGGLNVSGADLGSASAGSLNVTGIVTASGFSGNITGNVLGNVTGNLTGNVNASGVSTFTNGPVFIGTGTSTGTASQPLQVTGGAYVSGNLGVGITISKGKIHSVDSTYKCLVLSNTNNNNTSTGGVIAGERYTKTNNPFVAFASWDASTVRKVYVGGGGWNLPEATEIGLYTAATYDETNNAALERLKIDTSGRVTLPYQPSFRVYSPSGAVNTIITFGSTEFNIGNHMNAATGVFTAPIAGRYLFTFAILSGNPLGTYIRMNFCKNSTTPDPSLGDTLLDGLTNYGSPGMSMIFNLAANDTIRIRTEGSGTYGTPYGSFSGCLLG